MGDGGMDGSWMDALLWMRPLSRRGQEDPLVARTQILLDPLVFCVLDFIIFKMNNYINTLKK